MGVAKKSHKDLFDVVRVIARVKTLTAIEREEIVESAMKWVGDNCCPVEVFGLETLKDTIEEIADGDIRDAEEPLVEEE